MNPEHYARVVRETLGKPNPFEALAIAQERALIARNVEIASLRWRLAGVTRLVRSQARTIARHEANLRYAESIISTLRGFTE